MKKIIPILMIGIVVLSYSSAGFVETSAEQQPRQCLRDELDQYQDVAEQDIFLPVGGIEVLPDQQVNFSSAQSFIPQKEFLSQVELLLARNITTTYPLQVQIKDDLYGPVLSSAMVPASAVSDTAFEWVLINLPDVAVLVDHTYYVVLATANISDNFYGWAGNTDGFSYMDGVAWLSIDDGKTWGNESTSVQSYVFSGYESSMQPLGTNPSDATEQTLMVMQNGTWDMCFKTYGYNEPPLLTISRPENGIYVANELLCYFSEPVIIGVIRIEVDAIDHSGVETVEFFVDEQLIHNTSTMPYYYLWQERLFFKHFLKVVATDTLGMKQTVELEVWKFF